MHRRRRWIGWVVQLDGGGKALEVRRRGIRAAVRWKRVQAEQRRVKGGVERGRPRVRIGRRDEGGACPGESSAALMDVLDGGAGG